MFDTLLKIKNIETQSASAQHGQRADIGARKYGYFSGALGFSSVFTFAKETGYRHS